MERRQSAHSPSRPLTDIERLLRQLARERVTQLARTHAPVYPDRVAREVVCSRLNLTPVVVRRYELEASLADFVRELRAEPDDAE